jgi:hypothetical protein
MAGMSKTPAIRPGFSVTAASQQIIYLVLDLIGQVFGALQSGRTVATVILIGIESPKGGN